MKKLKSVTNANNTFYKYQFVALLISILWLPVTVDAIGIPIISVLPELDYSSGKALKTCLISYLLLFSPTASGKPVGRSTRESSTVAIGHRDSTSHEQAYKTIRHYHRDRERRPFPRHVSITEKEIAWSRKANRRCRKTVELKQGRIERLEEKTLQRAGRTHHKPITASRTSEYPRDREFTPQRIKPHKIDRMRERSESERRNLASCLEEIEQLDIEIASLEKQLVNKVHNSTTTAEYEKARDELREMHGRSWFSF